MTSPATENPQIPDPNKPFDHALLGLANRLRQESFLETSDDITDAAIMALTNIGTGTLTEAGTEHYPVPRFLPVGNAAVGACFMAACATSIIGHLKDREITLDIQEVFSRAGFAVYQMYNDEQKAELISGGGYMFRQLVTAADEHPNVKEWIANVQQMVWCYVLTGDQKYFPLFKSLYLTLCNVCESKANK